MTSQLSFVQKSSVFFLTPMRRLENLDGKMHNLPRTARNLYIYGGGTLGWIFAQTVASVVAVPFQLLAGIFSACYQMGKGHWKEGVQELTRGLISMKNNGVRVLKGPFQLLGVSLILILILPLVPFSWNTPFRAALTS